MHRIYVAGPILRGDSAPQLAALYQQIASAAHEAQVELVLPLYEKTLAALSPRELLQAISRRINEAHSFVGLMDAPGARPSTNVAVSGEGFLAAAAHKPLAIVAADRSGVPSLLQALSTFLVVDFEHADYKTMFEGLRAATMPTHSMPARAMKGRKKVAVKKSKKRASRKSAARRRR